MRKQSDIRGCNLKLGMTVIFIYRPGHLHPVARTDNIDPFAQENKNPVRGRCEIITARRLQEETTLRGLVKVQGHHTLGPDGPSLVR